jgi:hypothetical protein
MSVHIVFVKPLKKLYTGDPAYAVGQTGTGRYLKQGSEACFRGL